MSLRSDEKLSEPKLPHWIEIKDGQHQTRLVTNEPSREARRHKDSPRLNARSRHAHRTQTTSQKSAARRPPLQTSQIAATNRNRRCVRPSLGQRDLSRSFAARVVVETGVSPAPAPPQKLPPHSDGHSGVDCCRRRRTGRHTTPIDVPCRGPGNHLFLN